MGNSQIFCKSEAAASKEEEKYADEGKSSEAEEKCLVQKEKELQEKIEQFESSLKADNTQENALLKYAELLKLKHDMNGGLSGFEDIVKSAKEQWNVVNTNLDNMKKYVAPKDIDDLKGLRIDYFSLLLRTNQVLTRLVEKSKIQQRYVAELIRLTKIQNKCVGFKLTETNDQIMYDSCMKKLAKFIDEDSLQKNVQEWEGLAMKLEEKQTIFTTVYKKYQRQSLIKKVAIGVGAVVVIASIVALVVATSGVAAPALPGIGIFVEKCILAGSIGLSVGCVMVGGALTYGHFYIPSKDTLSKIDEITAMLKSMLVMSEKWLSKSQTN